MVVLDKLPESAKCSLPIDNAKSALRSPPVCFDVLTRSFWIVGWGASWPFIPRSCCSSRFVRRSRTNRSPPLLLASVIGDHIEETSVASPLTYMPPS